MASPQSGAGGGESFGSSTGVVTRVGDVDVVPDDRDVVDEVVVLLEALTTAAGAPVRAFVTGRTTPMMPSDAAPPATRNTVSRLLKLPIKVKVDEGCAEEGRACLAPR